MPKTNHLDIFRQGAAKWNAFREKNPEERMDLRHLNDGRTHIVSRELDLKGYNLEGIDFSSSRLVGFSFEGIDLSDCNFQGATLTKVPFNRATVAGANFSGAILAGSSWEGARGVPQATNLLRALAGSKAGRPGVSPEGEDVVGFDKLALPWCERSLGWERIRVLGQLPFFTASYATLVFVPLYGSFLRIINQHIGVAKKWASDNHGDTPDLTAESIAHAINENLSEINFGWTTSLVLGSAVLLAIASTIFAVRCPGRIREFSATKWTDEMDQSIIHYRPLSWADRRWRSTCGICFWIGGSLGLVVLIVKICGVLDLMF